MWIVVLWWIAVCCAAALAVVSAILLGLCWWIEVREIWYRVRTGEHVPAEDGDTGWDGYERSPDE